MSEKYPQIISKICYKNVFKFLRIAILINYVTGFFILFVCYNLFKNKIISDFIFCCLFSNFLCEIN